MCQAKLGKAGREDPTVHISGVPSPCCSLEVTVTFSVCYRTAAHQRAMGPQNPRDPEAPRLLLEARRSWTSTEI